VLIVDRGAFLSEVCVSYLLLSDSVGGTISRASSDPLLCDPFVFSFIWLSHSSPRIVNKKIAAKITTKVLISRTYGEKKKEKPEQGAFYVQRTCFYLGL